MKKKINIIYNEVPFSQETAKYLFHKLKEYNYDICEEFTPDADLTICIGGDGSFLRALHTYNYPDIPIVGINTGHLGFLAEIDPDGIDYFLNSFKAGHYSIQKVRPVKSSICTGNSCIEQLSVNEMVIKGDKSRTIHLDIHVDGQLVQKFSGDGILISTSLGSTAYNYSVGGSIVDPRLEVIQLTPLAPINTNAYRSFTSSIILPNNAKIKVTPEYRFEDNIVLVNDGLEHRYSKISEIDLQLSSMELKMIRLKHSKFWNRVIDKFL